MVSGELSDLKFQPQMIERWGYQAMIYSVTTDDGYILELHRIPNGRTNVTWPNWKKPVIFMQHGLLCASSDWTMNLPEQTAGRKDLKGKRVPVAFSLPIRRRWLRRVARQHARQHLQYEAQRSETVSFCVLGMELG